MYIGARVTAFGNQPPKIFIKYLLSHPALSRLDLIQILIGN